MRNLRAINRFGSKVGSAHRYPAPRHRLIIEPFAGGAGYALLHHEHDVLLFDLDLDVVNVWRYLVETSPDEIRRLPLIAPGQDVQTLDCSDGGRLLISWCLNQGPSPVTRPSSWAVYHTERGAACYWGAQRREQAALIASRVKHWKVALGDYRESPDVEATWFIDPPYVDGGKSYRHSRVDYQELAGWCRSRRGQTIVCEREGADWLPFEPLYSAPTARRYLNGARQRSAEAVWLNDSAGHDVDRKVNSEMTKPVYVFTREQFIEALIRGAALTGTIPDQLVNTSFDQIGAGGSPVSVALVENGAIVSFDFGTAPETTAGNATAPPAKTGPASETVLEDTDEGPDPQVVKESLAKVMPRVPSVATIRKWDAKQRRAAVRWAKAGGDKAKQPAHVVEPSPRKPRGAETENPGKAEASTNDDGSAPDGEIELFDDGEDDGDK